MFREYRSLLKPVLMLCAVLLLLPLLSAVGTSAERPSAPAATAVPAASTPPAVTVKAADAERQTYFDEFAEKFRQGGLTMYFLLFLSVVGIGSIIERLVNLNRRTIATPGLAEEANRLYAAGEFDRLTKLCHADRSILSHVILGAVEHRECDRDSIQSVCDDIGSRELRLQMQKAYPLSIVATLSPLLGLFGTVIGMIGAFDTVSQAQGLGDASLLADDIAKALITTAGGLLVAIPMLGFYHYFKSRTNRYAILLEEDAGELFSAWFLRKQPAAAQPAAQQAAAGCSCCQGEGSDAL